LTLLNVLSLFYLKDGNKINFVKKQIYFLNISIELNCKKGILKNIKNHE